MSHQHPIEKVKIDVKELQTKVSNLVTEHSTLVEEVTRLRTRVEAPPPLQDQNLEFLVTQLRLERELRTSFEEQLQHERDSKATLEEQLKSERNKRLSLEEQLEHERDSKALREKKISAEELLRLSEEKLQIERVAGEAKFKELQDKLNAAEQQLASLGATAQDQRRDTAVQTVDREVNQRDSEGRTQLFLAADKGDLAKVEELLSQGADANIGSTYGATPLHRAAFNGNVEICASLLDKGGANVNASNKYMWTSLHCASYNGDVDVVKLLLERGADTTAKDNQGQSARDVACLWGNHDRREETRRLLAQVASTKR